MTSRPGAYLARCWAGFASLGAGLVHTAVLVPHATAWWAYGAFFAVVAVYQVGWGVAALACRRPPLPRLTAALTGAVLVVWAITRTTGLPFGPDARVAEPAGVPDLATSALQVATLVLLAAAVRVAPVAAPAADPAPAGGPRSGSRQRPAVRLALLAAGAVAMSAVTTPALAATEAGEHAHPHGHHGTEGHDR